MKFLHLSDLHIGKRVHECSMIEEQKYIFKKILRIVEEEKIEGVWIAGDVYDKQVPSAEAVRLFDDFLTRLVARNLFVFVISGNHDSPERIAFGAEIMKSNRVFLSPVYDGKVEAITLTDEWGEINVYLLPYIKPIHVKTVFDEPGIKTYDEAVKYAVDKMEVDIEKRNVIISHQFVTGAKTCESEEMTVGGVENIDVTIYDDFDYVALGHIHSPQKCKRETVRYAGSPLKYSFSEVTHEKVAVVVEMQEKGNVVIKEVPLEPRNDMRVIQGTYEELTRKKFYEDTNTKDYLQVILTDEGAIPNAVEKLRTIYPNLLLLEYSNIKNKKKSSGKTADVENKTTLELLQDFFLEQNGKQMSTEQEQFAKEIIEKLDTDV